MPSAVRVGLRTTGMPGATAIVGDREFVPRQIPFPASDGKELISSTAGAAFSAFQNQMI